jgi:hypothetical protein
VISCDVGTRMKTEGCAVADGDDVMEEKEGKPIFTTH